MKQARKGKLLIATPDLLVDHVFSKAVILMIDHLSEEGSFGLILNKPQSLNLKLQTTEFPLYFGGPVEKNKSIYFLHNRPDIIPDSLYVNEKTNLCFTGDNNIALKLVEDKILTKRNIKFFNGYSGWSKKQLQQEIKDKAWYIADNNIDIFNFNPKTLWQELLLQIDPSNIIWKNSPDNPNFN